MPSQIYSGLSFSPLLLSFTNKLLRNLLYTENCCYQEFSSVDILQEEIFFPFPTGKVKYTEGVF